MYLSWHFLHKVYIHTDIMDNEVKTNYGSNMVTFSMCTIQILLSFHPTWLTVEMTCHCQLDPQLLLTCLKNVQICHTSIVTVTAEQHMEENSEYYMYQP